MAHLHQGRKTSISESIRIWILDSDGDPVLSREWKDTRRREIADSRATIRGWW